MPNRRQKYKVWKDHGKPNDKNDIMLREKKNKRKKNSDVQYELR